MWHHRLDLLRAGPSRRGAHPGSDDGHDGVPRTGRPRRLDRRPRGPRAPPAGRHRPARRPAADGRRGRRRGRRDRLLRRDLQLHRAARRAGVARTPLHDRVGHRGRATRLHRVGRRRRRTAQRHVRLRDLGRPGPQAAPDPRPHGHQTPVLRPDARRGPVRLRAQGDPGQPAGPARRRPGRAARAVRDGQDPGARLLGGHERGRAGHRRHDRPGGHPHRRVLDAGDPRAHRRPRRQRRVRQGAAGGHRAPPARRRRAALRPALRRPRLLHAHRPVRAAAGRDRGEDPQLRRRLRRPGQELRARFDPRRPRHPVRARRSPSTPRPCTRTSCWTPRRSPTWTRGAP